MTAVGARDDALPEPGHRAARRARDAIEDTLFLLPEIPFDFDRRGVRDRLLRSIHFLYAVIDSPVTAMAHLDGLTESARAVSECRVLLERAAPSATAAALTRTIELLLAADVSLRAGAEAVSRIQLERRMELSAGGPHEVLPRARPFRASRGIPSLHALERLPLLPEVDVEPSVPIKAPVEPARPLPRPATFEALRALAEEMKSGGLERRLLGDEAEPVPARDELLPLAYAPAIEEAEMLRRIGRDLLETIACHRNLRKPNAIESWLDQAPFERRLLDNLDAFAALGGAALPLVSLFHAEAKAPDPERAFAAALTLGSIEGSDTAGAAVMILKQSPPEEYPGWIEGFWLAPSPALDAAMVDLCTSRRPELVALALDVLHARGGIPDGVVAALLDREGPAIAARVARALATALPRQDAIRHLERICTAAEDDDLFVAAVGSLLRLGHGPAIDLLRRTIDTSASAVRVRWALPLLCLVGRSSDLDRLLTAVHVAPTVHLVRSLGRFGHIKSLGTLLKLMEHEDARVIAAAAEAMDRITGAGMRETVEEPWDIELPPEAGEAGGIPVPARKVERIVDDPERWSAWLHDKVPHLCATLKTRGGVPFTPLQIVGELEARMTPPADREEAALELALVTGLRFPFSPHDWVARQHRHLSDLRARVAALEVAPGAWSYGLARAPEQPSARPPVAEEASGSPLPPPEPARPERHEAYLAESRSAPATMAAPPAFVPSAALPFQPAGPGDGGTPAPRLPKQAATTRSSVDVTETAAAPLSFEKPALPFRSTGAASVDAALEDERRSSTSVVGTASAPLGPAAPPLPRDGPAHGAGSPGSSATSPLPEAPETEAVLSLAQYASLCAELAVFPWAAEAIFQRYGLEAREKRAIVDAAWKEKLRRDRGQYETWQQLYHSYRDCWMKRSPSAR